MLKLRGPRTAFSLSGGGARGAVQVGCLLALAERGIKPDLIVGTSVGAWNGAWLASQPTLERVHRLADIWATISRTSFGMAWWRAARNYTFRRPSLYDGHGLARLIARHLEAHRFEDLAVPFFAVAINMTRCEKAVLSRGPLAPAVLASSAIPGIFPPMVLNGEQYVDGGMADPAGIETALELGATRIYVLDAGYQGVLASPIRSIDTVVDHAVQVGAYQRIRSTVREARKHAEVVWLRPNSGFLKHSMDFRYTAHYIEDGHRYAARQLEGAVSRPAGALARLHLRRAES